MTRSPLFNFLFGMIAGAAIVAGALGYLAHRGFEQLGDQGMAAIQQWKTVATGYQVRAQSCEAKFSIGTIVYEPHPLATIPVTGSIAVSVGEDYGPTIFIPAEVHVYTNLPGVRYVWQDMKTGNVFAAGNATSPSTMPAIEKGKN